MNIPEPGPKPSVKLLPWVLLTCLVVLVVVLCIFHG